MSLGWGGEHCRADAAHLFLVEIREVVSLGHLQHLLRAARQGVRSLVEYPRPLLQIPDDLPGQVISPRHPSPRVTRRPRPSRFRRISPSRVRGVEPLRGLGQQFDRPFYVQRAFLADHLLEIGSLDVAHGDEQGAVVGLRSLVDGNNVRVVDRRGQATLKAKALSKRLIRGEVV